MMSRSRGAISAAGIAEPLAALAIYAVASIVFFGIPLFRDFTHLRLGFGPAGDPQIPIWGLAWYPWALAHRLNPLRTDFAWAPMGCSLAWSTTIPGAALLMWPVTRMFGLIASYNILCLLTPALSGFTAFLLCRHVARDFWAALIGGFIFGFSTYVSGELLDHLSLAMVLLIPLFPYLGLAYLERGMGRGKFAAALAALVVGQFLLSPEILATATLFGAATVFVAMRLSDETQRRRLGSLAALSGVSYGIAVILLAPALVSFFPSPFGFTPIYNPAHCSSDLLNFILPIDPSMFSRIPSIHNFVEHLAWGCEASAFLGLFPFLAIFFAVGRPSSSSKRLLLAMLLIVAIATLGPVLHFDGKALLPLPWLLAMPVPLLNNALPARFTVFLFLVLALITAIWLARRDGFIVGRWILAVGALLSILPALPMTPYVALENLPPFIQERLYKKYISADEIVLILPFGWTGYSLFWQAEADFAFRTPQGRLLANAIPPEFAQWPIVPALAADNPYIPDFAVQFAAFLGHYRIRTVLVDPAEEKNFTRLFGRFRWRRTEVRGVTLYQIDPAELAEFGGVTGKEMEVRFNLTRFAILLRAAHAALESGLELNRLNPLALRDRGLLAPTLVGDASLPQLSEYAPLVRLCGSRAARSVLRHLASLTHIDYRLMAELGPVRKAELSTSGVWVGPWNGDGVAIGVVGSRQGVDKVIGKYGRSATEVFYPYPLKYHANNPVPDGQNLLLMVFLRATLEAPDLEGSAAGAVHGALAAAPK